MYLCLMPAPDALPLALPEQLHPVVDEISGRILDAAREQFRVNGVRRTAVDLVARRSGVSRVTVYRRYPRKEDLVRAVFLREAQLLFDAVDRAVSVLPAAEDQLVEGFVAILSAGREHSLIHGLLEVEPESVLPFFTLDGGPVLALARDYLAGQLRRGQQSGQLRDADAEALAELAVRLTVSFMLTPDSCLELDTEDDLRAFARRYLVPVIVAPGQRS
jgi:AcrR family transcriptional regulator